MCVGILYASTRSFRFLVNSRLTRRGRELGRSLYIFLGALQAYDGQGWRVWEENAQQESFMRSEAWTDSREFLVISAGAGSLEINTYLPT